MISSSIDIIPNFNIVIVISVARVLIRPAQQAYHGHWYVYPLNRQQGKSKWTGLNWYRAYTSNASRVRSVTKAVEHVT